MPSPLQLLRIDAHGLDAFQCHNREITRLASFETGELDRFTAWLRTQPHTTRYRILADLVDERFEIETLPRIRGADRRALITRRLTNGFPDPNYAKAETLNIDRNAGTEQLLFSGLARLSRLEPWVSALHESGRTTEFTTSPSQLMAHFLPGERPVLTVSFSRAGMRLTLIEANRASFSRLVESAHAEAVLNDANWQIELDRTLHYALTQRTELSGHKLGVVVIAPATALSLGDAATNAGHPTPKHLAPSELGAPRIAATEHEALHAHPPATDSSALLLHWLNGAPRKLGWSGPNTAHTARLRLAAAVSLGVSALLLVAGIGLATQRWQARQAATNELTQLQREITLLQHERSVLSAEHAMLDAKPTQIIDTVRHVANQRNSTPDPLTLLARLANAFEKHPELELQTLAWSPLQPSSPSHAPAPAVARVRLTLTPSAPTPTKLALDALTNDLEAEGAHDIALKTGFDGIAHVELQLPIPVAAEPDR